MTDRRRKLKIFLCYDSGDLPQVRVLSDRLTEGGVDVWLDQEQLLPGQDWEEETREAVREADVVVICLSNNSITRVGDVQRQMRFALSVAEEKPDGSIFIIPARLEECEVPQRMKRWHRVDLFTDDGYQRLMEALRARSREINALPVTIIIAEHSPTLPTISSPAGQRTVARRPTWIWTLVGILALLAIAVVIVIRAVGPSAGTSAEPTATPVSLSAAGVEFAVTVNRTVETIPPYGTLILSQGNQIRIETVVTDGNGGPYPNQLRFQYSSGLGLNFTGKITPYTAGRSDDIINVQIQDQVTGDTIRSFFFIHVN